MVPIHKLSILAVCLLASVCHGGKFLFYMPAAFRSMKISFMPLVKELASRGHNVTIICPKSLKEDLPGITEIVHDSAIETYADYVTNQALVDGGGDVNVFKYVDITIESNEAALAHPKVRDLIISGDKFDVVTVCCTIFGDEAGYFLAQKFNASLVLYHAKTHSNPWVNWATGNPFNPAYMPFFASPFSSSMNLPERVVNTVKSVGASAIRNWFVIYKVERLLGRQFPEETLPDLLEVERNSALAMYAGTPFWGDGLHPVLPNMLLVGMMNCRPGKPLPEKLKQWVEEAEHGVVYMSFGSVLRASAMPVEKKEMFLKVFSNLKQRVIWKWEEDLSDLPENVMVSKWLPQPDLLAHSNIKLFITHGGAGSIQDILCHPTPVLGIPLNNDQMTNLHEAQVKGIAEVINWNQLTEDTVLQRIQTILKDNKYQTNVDKLGQLVMDQPMHPVDRAAWWMEYVLRHPGNEAMRSPALRLAWWQYFLLDVLLVMGLVVGLLVGCVAKICSLFCRRGKKKQE